LLEEQNWIKMLLDSNFLEFIGFLNKNDVRFVLVGGYAVVINGHNRTTGDLDIFIDIEDSNIDKILKAIDDFGFGSIGFTKDDFKDENSIVQMGVPPLRIDILSSLPGVTFEEVIDSAKDYEEDDVKMKVIHINHLIKNKIAVGREKDNADAKALQNILKREK
jgi:predicted nucleotidyltransferase